MGGYECRGAAKQKEDERVERTEEKKIEDGSDKGELSDHEGVQRKGQRTVLTVRRRRAREKVELDGIGGD